MGLSSNQARFLSLTSRQIDLEQRVQQICQRRLRLATELENVATNYNKNISNRRLFQNRTDSLSINGEIKDFVSLENLYEKGYYVMEKDTNTVFGASAHYSIVGTSLKDSDVTSLGSNKTIGGQNFQQVSYKDAQGSTVTAYRVDTKAQLEALAGVSGTVSDSFILMSDIDISGNNWGVIDSFAGNFNGNMHTISGLTINTPSTAQSSVGLFGNITSSGKVQNLNLTDTNINVGAGSFEVGSIAGTNDGTIDNVCSDQIAITINGVPGDSTNAAYNAGTNTLGGLVGGNCGTIDRVAALGRLTTTGTGYIDGVGSLVGTNGSTSGTITKSEAAVDIYTNATSLGCVNTFLGCDATAGNYSDCFTTSMIYKMDGTVAPDTGYQNTYFSGHNSATDITNCYKLKSDGTYAYWNGTVNGQIANSSSSMDASAWDQDAWDTSTLPPSLNNYKLRLQYNMENETLTDEQLEEGLRDGRYTLVKDSDALSQETISPSYLSNLAHYESIDWRTVPEINDELYKSDDADAETTYANTISQINSQDKRLQLEQTNVETEYRAVSTEKEAVKKILDTNAQASFKYFG